MSHIAFANDVLGVLTDGSEWDSDTIQSIADLALEHGLAVCDATGFLVLPEDNEELRGCQWGVGDHYD